MIVAEGRRLVGEALASGCSVAGLIAAEDAAATTAADPLAEAARRRIETLLLPRQEFDRLADTETPSGVMAVVEWAPAGLGDIGQLAPGAVLLVLDGVQDPGNAGTMLRTAHALGAAGTVVLDGTVDVRSPKVVRGAMGAHFRHRIVEAAFGDFAQWARESGVAVHVATMDGEMLPRVSRPSTTIALVVGSEGHGTRAGWEELKPVRVAIPMAKGAESLNAGVAAGIMLYAYCSQAAGQ